MEHLKLPEFGCARSGSVNAIPVLLQQYAHDRPQQILEELGLAQDLLDAPDNSISFKDLGRLMDVCVQRTNLAHFGLLVGQHAGPEAVGHLAELVIHAPDVETALHSMIMHVSLNDRGAVPTLSSANGTAKLGFAIYVPMHDGSKHIYSAALAILCNLLRSMCGDSWAPTEVRFSQSQPSDIKPYISFFRAPLIFDSEEDALVFSDQWLKRHLTGADIEKHHIAMNRLANIQNAQEIGFIEKVYFVLRPMIVSQHCSLEALGKALSLHPRTLNRRFRDHGTSYRELVGKIRFEVARQLLMNTSMSIIKISTTLGYADPSVFTRAFRRWSGIPPSDWRMRNSR